MTEHTPNMVASRSPIRPLDEAAINRIAAGEVVERPASIVKELIENALDAGARRIGVDYAAGGRTLIRVTDDGVGMTAADLPLALARHATSKIDGSDLFHIHSFGFRGEALPSIGAVATLVITSRAAGHDGAEISCDLGRLSPVRPAALNSGTVVEVRDLFRAIPARRKFLRSDRGEARAIHDVVRNLAMADPMTGFTLSHVADGERRVILRLEPETGDLFDAMRARLTRLLGADFITNALRIDTGREGVRLAGYAALPTYSRGSSARQHFFVNGRPVADRLLLGALRAAYRDVLPKGRHPAAMLNVTVEPERVDVNVHPAKAEVRFRDPASVRGLVITAIRTALLHAGHRSSTTIARETLTAFHHEAPPDAGGRAHYAPEGRPSPAALGNAASWQAPPPATALSGFAERPSARPADAHDENAATAFPLGAARAQLHENWIIAQTTDGIVIVDQHAAHERLNYERLKQQLATGIPRQVLLIPDIVPLSPSDADLVLAAAPELARAGLVIEPFGGNAVAITETPAILGEVDGAALIADILDELAEGGTSDLPRECIHAVLSSMACHGSIRSGRRMRTEEMDALLREMEATPKSGQCNHGRPTWVELKLHDIERLFGRR